jgi:uncharacterized protein GlcG (DUF336 family)
MGCLLLRHCGAQLRRGSAAEPATKSQALDLASPFCSTRVMIFAGSIPLKRGDDVVGAVRVIGEMGKQDQDVAEAGAEAF